MRKMSALLLGVSLFACTSPVKQLESGEICGNPIAEAGADQTVGIGIPVVLSGVASSWCEDYDEDIIFIWSFVSMPAESAVNENSLSGNRNAAAITPQFTPDMAGDYVLSLQLNDGVTVSNIDYVVVSVVAGGSPPIADCGGSYQGEVGSIVTINGSASSSSTTEFEYAWSLNTPSCSRITSSDIYNEGTPRPSFVPDCAGTYAVNLSVSDGSQWSDPVICAVEVDGVNNLPVADAGKTEAFGGCAPNPFQLNGHSSYDADGDVLAYSWALVSAPATSTATDTNFNDTSSATPEFTWDVEGTYTFQLQVNDGNGWSAPDLVDVSIASLENNHRPIANAGNPLTIEVSASCQDTSYSSECADCPPYTFLLDGSGTMDIDGDVLSFAWEEATGGLQIVTPEAAVTTAIIPRQAVATTLNFEVSLEVSDCERSDSDLTSVTYSCVSN